MRLLLLSVLSAMAVAPSSLLSQSSTFTLAAPTWTAAEGLSTIAGVGAFADGRLLIADSRERLLYLAARDGSIEAHGSTGQGPGEYRSAFSITRLRGDTLLVFDGLNRRFLRYAHDGRQLRDIDIPIEILQAGGLGPVPGADDAGRLYWVGDVMGELNGRAKRAAIHRIRAWVPGKTTVNIVAPLRDHSDERHAQQFHPLAHRDAFVVAADGRVGVLSATDRRLRWYRDNRLESEGPVLTYPKPPLTAAERVAFRRARAAQPAAGMRSTGGSNRDEPSTQMMRTMNEAYPDALFPDELPPFDADAVRRSPGGDIWATLSASAGARQLTVDIVRENGVRRGSLRLPEGRRLVALAPEGIYLARTDEDGLEWLERYAYPAGLR